MNDRTFNNWKKLRVKGCVSWLLSTTVPTSILYMVFNFIFLSPSLEPESLMVFLSDNILQYFIYSLVMFFGFLCYWFYNESLYKKEVKRRGIV